MDERKRHLEKIMGIVMLVIFGLTAFFANVKPNIILATKHNETDGKMVVILDAGHGGYDPGKIGINGKIEKDINLQIAEKLQKILENKGIKVVMTRKSDTDLFRAEEHIDKVEDMEKRIEIAEKYDKKIFVSIHQNSFTTESVRGPQVFYYKASVHGKELAELIQNEMNSIQDESHRRMIKENSDYYLLKNICCPAVIVEGGFLSNWEEATLLCDEVYQTKIAESISVGIEEYFNKIFSLSLE